MNSPHLKTERISETGGESSLLKAPAGFSNRILERFRVWQWMEGGFAFVAAVEDARTGERFAVKIPKALDESLAEFEDEVSFWLRLLPHPNIVKAFRVEPVEQRPGLFLEFVGGHALNTLRALLSGGRALELEQGLEFAREIALALEFAGRDLEIAHLDLKPENLMITAEGRLKVTDFGLARRIRVEQGRFAKISSGTWPYVPPEWFEGKPLDSRADIYAWGVVCYEMLTGRLPFEIDASQNVLGQMRAYHESGKLRRLKEELWYNGCPGVGDRRIGELLSRCFEWYPGERPRSFSEIRSIVEGILRVNAAEVMEEPLSVEERFERAVSLCKVQRADEALSLFNRLMVEQPNSKTLWLSIAEVLETIGKSQTAASIRERFPS